MDKKRNAYKSSQRYLKPDQRPELHEKKPSSKTRPPPRVFLSHSAQDRALADQLRGLLERGCSISPDDLFYSSNPDTGIHLGKNVNAAVRRAFATCEIFVALITPNYNKSSYCLSESGAAWFSSKKSVFLVCPPLTPSEIRAPADSIQSVDMSSDPGLDSMRDFLSKQLRIEPTSTSRWNFVKGGFLGALPKLLDVFDESRQRGTAAIAANLPLPLAAIAAVIHNAKPGDGIFAIILDIDRLGQINEHHGQLTGSKLLKAASLVLERLARGSPQIISFELCGDDTFFLLTLGSEANAAGLAGQALEMISRLPLQLKRGDIEFTASAGIAPFHNKDESAMSWLQRANHACNEARKKGGNRMEVNRTVEQLSWSGSEHLRPKPRTFFQS